MVNGSPNIWSMLGSATILIELLDDSAVQPSGVPHHQHLGCHCGHILFCISAAASSGLRGCHLRIDCLGPHWKLSLPSGHVLISGLELLDT